MTANAKAKVSLVDEIKGLNGKQAVAIIGAMIIAVCLQCVPFIVLMCFGPLLIAGVLYMVPHLAKVSSAKIKAVIGVVFTAVALLATVLVAGPMTLETGEDQINYENDSFGNIQYTDNGDGSATITMDVYDPNADNAKIYYGEIRVLSYTAFDYKEKHEQALDMVPVTGSGKVEYRISATLPFEDGTLYGYRIVMDTKVLDEDGKIVTGDDGKPETKNIGIAFLHDNGISKGELYSISLSGFWVYVAITSAIFFIILIFSTAIRMSAEKSRVKMEADGRLYPKGYGRCKECGGMVLPGEVNCRKCGAYIDVPEELRVKKKDYFVCENCGAEVPNDAEMCPKCGAKFDSVENEVVHSDGSVDVSEETFECSECGAVVPANATRCPKCGAKFDEDEKE